MMPRIWSCLLLVVLVISPLAARAAPTTELEVKLLAHRAPAPAASAAASCGEGSASASASAAGDKSASASASSNVQFAAHREHRETSGAGRATAHDASSGFGTSRASASSSASNADGRTASASHSCGWPIFATSTRPLPALGCVAAAGDVTASIRALVVEDGAGALWLSGEREDAAGRAPFGLPLDAPTLVSAAVAGVAPPAGASPTGLAYLATFGEAGCMSQVGPA